MSKTVFLGVEGSGKTTLTMALAKAFERHRDEGWYLKPLSRDSFRFLKMLPEDSSFAKGNFPSQTADLRELSWQVEYENKDFGDITILDYPGEIYRLTFLDEKDEKDPESFRQKVAANRKEIEALLSAVKESEAIYVLFNLQDAEDLGSNSRNLDAVWVTNACLHILKNLDSKPSIKLLLTQADRYRDKGLDLDSKLDIIAHDHSDISRQYISVLDDPASEHGIDNLIAQFLKSQIQDNIKGKLFAADDISFANAFCVEGKSSAIKVKVAEEEIHNLKAKLEKNSTVIQGADRKWLLGNACMGENDARLIVEDGFQLLRILERLVSTEPKPHGTIRTWIDSLACVLKTEWGKSQLKSMLQTIEDVVDRNSSNVLCIIIIFCIGFCLTVLLVSLCVFVS